MTFALTHRSRVYAFSKAFKTFEVSQTNSSIPYQARHADQLISVFNRFGRRYMLSEILKQLVADTVTISQTGDCHIQRRKVG